MTAPQALPDTDGLALLGFRPDDARAFLDLTARLSDDDWTRVDEALRVLEAHVGALEARRNPLEGMDLDAAGVGQAVALVALVLVAPRTVAELVARGVDEATAQRSVSDLGQQVHVFRGAHGRFGFSATPWCAANASGSHLWLGRLQFTLEPSEGPALGVHIPATGPLTPELVDDALARALDVAVPAWAEFDVHRFVCDSWLLDRGLVAALPATSNVRRFAERFTPYGAGRDGRRDFLFFGFRHEPTDDDPLSLDDLPQDTSLQRAAVARLRTGQATCQQGWMPLR